MPTLFRAIFRRLSREVKRWRQTFQGGASAAQHSGGLAVTNGASRLVHIQNQARANGQNASELARPYMLEGMLARIEASDHADDFALKDGILPHHRSCLVIRVLAGFRQLPHCSGEMAFDYGSTGRGFKRLQAHQNRDSSFILVSRSSYVGMDAKADGGWSPGCAARTSRFTSHIWRVSYICSDLGRGSTGMTNASTLVRAARKSRQLTQEQLAARALLDQGSVSRSERGRDASFETIDRLLGGAGYRLYSAPTRRDDAATIAAEIRRQLTAGDKDRALRALVQLNDNLVAEHGLVRGILGLAEPESTRDRVWDAALAALVAWRLGEEGLPLPPWVGLPGRFLDGQRTLEVDPADPLPPISEVPDEFAKRGVFAWRDTFESV